MARAASAPVSYTHLDVYKRQPLQWSSSRVVSRDHISRHTLPVIRFLSSIRSVEKNPHCMYRNQSLSLRHIQMCIRDRTTNGQSVSLDSHPSEDRSEPPIQRIDGSIIIPVSYTHLDVYKRQTLSSQMRSKRPSNSSSRARSVLSSFSFSLRSVCSACWE